MKFSFPRRLLLTAVAVLLLGAAYPAIASAGSYNILTSAGTIVPGTPNIGLSGDDPNPVSVTLPFPVQLYGVTYTAAKVGLNGTIEYTSSAES